MAILGAIPHHDMVPHSSALTPYAWTGLGALSVVLDPGSVKSYDNEVEYAKARGEDLRTKKPHRCNDRLEDFIQVGISMSCCMEHSYTASDM